MSKRLLANAKYRIWKLYTGTYIRVDNSRGGLCKDVVLEGKTYQNLITGRVSYRSAGIGQSKWVTENEWRVFKNITEGSRTYPRIDFEESNLFKEGVTYTFTCTINTNRDMSNNSCGVTIGNNHDCYFNNSNNRFAWTLLNSDYSVVKLKFTYTSNGERCIKFGGPSFNDSGIKFFKVKDFAILEGDYTNKEIPSNIECIESVGSKEGKVTLTSQGTSENSSIEYPGVVLRSLPNGVADTLNVDTGVLTQRVGKVDLRTVPMGFSNPTDYYNSNSSCCLIAPKDLPNKKNGEVQIKNIMCDVIPIVNKLNFWMAINRDMNYCIGNVATTWACGIILPNSLTGVTSTDTANQTMSKFNNYLKSLSYPVYLYYELETPIVTQLTPKQVKSYQGGLTITTTNNIKANINATVPIKQ